VDYGIFTLILAYDFNYAKTLLRFGAIGINFIYKKSLAKLPLQYIAKEEGYLKVSSPELTAMDLVLYTRQSAGLGNIATVLYELIDSINANKLISLAKLTRGKGWVQRLGYILEQLDSDNDKSANHKTRVINKLAKYLAQQELTYLKLTPELPIKGCDRNSKWKIIENTTVESDL
jgi:predicted transcriptional regulator of viral defense system